MNYNNILNPPDLSKSSKSIHKNAKHTEHTEKIIFVSNYDVNSKKYIVKPFKSIYNLKPVAKPVVKPAVKPVVKPAVKPVKVKKQQKTRLNCDLIKFEHNIINNIENRNKKLKIWLDKKQLKCSKNSKKVNKPYVIKGYVNSRINEILNIEILKFNLHENYNYNYINLKYILTDKDKNKLIAVLFFNKQNNIYNKFKKNLIDHMNINSKNLQFRIKQVFSVIKDHQIIGFNDGVYLINLLALVWFFYYKSNFYIEFKKELQKTYKNKKHKLESEFDYIYIMLFNCKFYEFWENNIFDKILNKKMFKKITNFVKYLNEYENKIKGLYEKSIQSK